MIFLTTARFIDAVLGPTPRGFCCRWKSPSRAPTEPLQTETSQLLSTKKHPQHNPQRMPNGAIDLNCTQPRRYFARGVTTLSRTAPASLALCGPLVASYSMQVTVQVPTATTSEERRDERHAATPKGCSPRLPGCSSRFCTSPPTLDQMRNSWQKLGIAW